MKVIILAGGYGTRLGSITDDMPKPMVRVGSHPILWHIMKIYSHFGFKDFLLSVGYKQETIKEYFHNYHIYANNFEINLGTKDIKVINSDHDEKDWNVAIVNTGLNTGTGARIKRLEKHLDDDINMATYGDGVADIDIKKLVKFHKSHGKILTVTGVRPSSRFGEIVEKKGKIVSFKEKPQSSSGLINGGFFVFDKRIFRYLTEDESCDLPTQIASVLVPRGEVMVYKHLDSWECVDMEKDLKHLNNLWNQKKAFWKVWK